MDAKFRIVNRTKRELRAMVTPKSIDGGNLQAIPYVLFDTQTYTDAVTTRLTYFQTVQTDQTLGNMNSGGSLPIDTWLEVEWMFLTPIVPAVGAAVPNVWQDMDQLMHVGRPTHTLTIQDKDYGRIPASFFGAEGGIDGRGYNAAAVAATAEEYVNWGRGRGFWVGGQIVIPPQAGFNAQVNWNAAVTLPGGISPLVRLSYLGTLHRPIL